MSSVACVLRLSARSLRHIRSHKLLARPIVSSGWFNSFNEVQGLDQRNFASGSGAVPHGLLLARGYSSEAADTQKRLASMVKEDKVVVFMKGVPEQPRYS
jgi:hypothetical protein